MGDVLGAQSREARQQWPCRAIQSFHAAQSAHAGIIQQQLDRLVEFRSARQCARARLIDLPRQKPPRLMLVGRAAALINPAVADEIPELPFGGTRALENLSARALPSQLSQLC